MDLDPVELRVLGCLIEKQRTTPDQYPLSVNSLRLACNQSTSRDPVVDWEEATVREGVQRLSDRGWVRLASGRGSRTAKYRHLLADALTPDDAELATLAVLLLRGPQTAAEIVQRGERLHAFAPGEVEQTLGRLAGRELVGQRPPRPGQRGDRFVHLLGAEQAAEPAAAAAPESLEQRVAELESEVARLREQITGLRS